LVFWSRDIGFIDEMKISNEVAFEDCIYEIEQREK
jgi:hypothetical protein